MKTEPPIGIGCRITDDKLVIPDPGFEGPMMEDQGFRGEAYFNVLAARGTEPAYVICNALVPPVPLVVPPTLTEIVNFCWIDWDYTNNSAVVISGSKAVIVGLDSLGAPQLGDSGAGYDASDSGQVPNTTRGNIHSRVNLRVNRVYFYRWQGEQALLSELPYGINNRPVYGVVTVTADIRKRTYNDGDLNHVTDTLHETISWVLDMATDVPSPPVANGIPDNYFQTGIIAAQIATFAQIDPANEWTHTFYGSGYTQEAYYLDNINFTVVPP